MGSSPLIGTAAPAAGCGSSSSGSVKKTTKLRDLADTLWAVHTNDYDYAGPSPKQDDEKRQQHREVFVSTKYRTALPVGIDGQTSRILEGDEAAHYTPAAAS